MSSALAETRLGIDEGLPLMASRPGSLEDVSCGHWALQSGSVRLIQEA